MCIDLSMFYLCDGELTEGGAVLEHLGRHELWGLGGGKGLIEVHQRRLQLLQIGQEDHLPTGPQRDEGQEA